MKENFKNRFILGEDWLYYKIYLGVVTSDDLLENVIYPIAKSLLEDQIIDKWFFIRYSDPNYHLRIRFHLTSDKNILLITEKLNPLFNEYLDNRLIKDIQTSIYKRELKRYGRNTISYVEDIFHYDSVLISKFILHLNSNGTENLRWLFALLLMDNFFDIMSLSLSDKMNFSKKAKDEFSKEFNIDSNFNKQLSNKYRTNRAEIYYFLNLKKNTPNISNDNLQIVEMIDSFNKKISTIANKLENVKSKGKLQVDFYNLVFSLIHMSINRLFQTNNRLNEMVCYDFLYRYYESIYARFYRDGNKFN